MAGVVRFCVVVFILIFIPSSGWAAEQLTTGSVSGLPLPRFVSLKSDKVNVRGGPSMDHGVSWIYTKAGLPVEITAEYDNWRRIRDWEGAEGWVYHSMVSGRRMGLVDPKGDGRTFSLYSKADAASGLVAQLGPRVVVTLRGCNGQWCRLSGDGFDGWAKQDGLWGVYPGETFE